MQKSEIFNTKNMVRLALVAAAYVALTLAIGYLGYGPIQFRISEALVLLAFYRKDYSLALIVGCLIANLFSPYGLYDIIFGTLGTATAVVPMYYMKNIYLASLLPVVSNGLIVGFEFYLCGEPFWFSAGTVALSEIIIVCVIGIVLFKLLEKNSFFVKNLIGSTRTKKEKKPA